VTNDDFDPIHVILVLIAVTPFQHLVVGHDVLKSLLPDFASELEQFFTAIRCLLTSEIDSFNPSSGLFSFFVGIRNECPPQQSSAVNGG
jgi:hypothetical protein